MKHPRMAYLLVALLFAPGLLGLWVAFGDVLRRAWGEWVKP